MRIRRPEEIWLNRSAKSSEKRGPPRAEEDGPRCDARFLLASNRHTAILKQVLKK